MTNEMFKDIRGFKQMSMREFAKWLGVSLATVSMIECGHRNVSDFVAAKIARKFDPADEEFHEYRRRRKTLSG